MTCILGLKHQGHIYLGADSLYLNGWHRIHTDHPKIFRLGGLLIGSEQSQRVSDIMEYNLELPQDCQSDPATYLGRDFIPALRACLIEHGAMKDEQMEAVIMIGYRAGLFIIGEDFTLSEIAGPYEAIGAGAKYALGYLYTMHKTSLSPEKMIENALGCAEHFCAGVRAPFIIMECK